MSAEKGIYFNIKSAHWQVFARTSAPQHSWRGQFSVKGDFPTYIHLRRKTGYLHYAIGYNRTMSGFREVKTARAIRVGDYNQFFQGTETRLRRAARRLKGKRILHINATAIGGGVAELLDSQVPFENALGMKSRWFVLEAPARFFGITKQIHNLLQGKNARLDGASKNFYHEVGHDLGRALARLIASFRPHLVVIHDPQPLAAIGACAAHVPVIVRLHGDLFAPNPQMLEFIRPFLEKAERVVVSSHDYVKNFPWLSPRAISVIYPAIDPLSIKNRPFSVDTARQVLQEFGVNPTKPLIAQISRFDPWKDPMGVIQSYYKAKNAIPNVQMILMGFILAQDDPEAVGIFRQVKKHAKGDPDIFLFADPRAAKHASNDVLVSAAYTASDVVVQKSIREGFGLTITEAMWKGKALVAGKTSGALLQVKNKKNGILVSSSEDAAKAIVRLLRDEKLRVRLGRAARESVRRRFLMPRFVADNLRLYTRLQK